MAKTTKKTPKTQEVRTRGAEGKVKLTGRLLGGKYGKHTYLVIRDEADTYLDVLEGQRLYRLAKAICRRFEAAQ
jgi:hypothetical protein